MWSVEVRVLVEGAATMSHPNAPLTIEGRRRLMVRIASGVSIAHVTAQMGVLRVAASKWWHRYKGEGEAGLGEQVVAPPPLPRCSEGAVGGRDRGHAPYPQVVRGPHQFRTH